MSNIKPNSWNVKLQKIFPLFFPLHGIISVCRFCSHFFCAYQLWKHSTALISLRYYPILNFCSYGCDMKNHLLAIKKK